MNEEGTESPTAVKNSYTTDLDSAALQQMAYDSNFTEDINVKMRIPEKLTVAQESASTNHFSGSSEVYKESQGYHNVSSYPMEVPDRIVVSVGEQGIKYGGSRDFSEDIMYNENYTKTNSQDPVTLATPPRKLTLAERDLDMLDIPDSHEEQTSTSGIRRATEIRSNESSLSTCKDDTVSKVRLPVTRPKQIPVVPIHMDHPFHPNGVIENIQFNGRQVYQEMVQAFTSVYSGRKSNVPSKVSLMKPCGKGEPSRKKGQSSSSMLLEPMVPAVQQNESLEELDDITLLRRQVFKLHRRITSIEKQQTEKSKRDVYMYAITVAFWLFNGWFLYSSRKLY